MASSSALDGQKHFKVGIEPIPVSRKRMGQGMILLASAILVAVVLIQILYKTETITVGLDNWRPVLYAYYYIATVAVEFVIAFVLALLINAQIRARKFFRIAKKDCQSTCKTIKGK